MYSHFLCSFDQIGFFIAFTAFSYSTGGEFPSSEQILRDDFGEGYFISCFPLADIFEARLWPMCCVFG